MPDALHESNHDDTSDSRASEAFVFPASFAQRRLWFVDQFDPGCPVYNAPAAFRVGGPLDHAALEHAVNAIVARHESLRTTFRLIDGEPSQVIAPELHLRVPVVDLRALQRDAREHELAQFIGREAWKPFDLATGPLLRVTLVQLGDADHALLLVFHHIVTDMWSQEIFMRELAALYGSFRSARPCPLPALPVQYADFAQWQRGQFEGEALGRELAYWKQKLDGLAPLELPLSRARPPVPAHHGRTLEFEIDAALTASLKQLAHSEAVSLFMLVLAAWKTLLFRYTAQTDVSVGSPISNRHRAETEPLIGFFLNTLLLRTDLAGNPPFRALLGRVRETVLGAFANDSLPFDVLVEKLHPSRAAGQNPLFNVAFVLVHDGGKPLSLPGLTFTPMRIAQVNAKFDLTVMLNETDTKVTGSIEFNTDLFDEPFVARMTEHFQTLLSGIAAAPDTPIESLELPGAEEREWLVNGLNATARPFPSHKTVAVLFEEQVARTPERVAIECGDGRVTYAELNGRANRVARHLRSLGAGHGSRTGVCMERSVELIVCILAIVKAGGACVPLDAASPPERVAVMLEESGSGTVLTRTGGADLKGAVVFDATDFSGYDAANLPTGGGGDDLAYVIFTSGSTGKPKGVAVPHRAIARLVINAGYAQVTPDDVVAHASNTGFDAATFEIWGALLNGATLAIASHDVLLSTAAFASFLAERKVTTLFLTTALFNQIAVQNPASFRGLTTLLFGGEASNPDCVRRVLEQGAPKRLVHVYGPTEATTFASWHLVREVPANAVTVPIGLPISNTAIHILDSHFQPLPCGIAGEIFIGGPGLATGYLNDAELTALRFLQTPFGLLYRTGDLGKRRIDGAIEFCGRIDSQLKLRGYRIEPGEIEAALRQHPLVRHAAVVARTEAGTAQSLIGYLVPQSDGRVKVEDLRQFLSRRLPAYMIPPAFVWLAALPLTPNGKLDTRRLPPPDLTDVAGPTAPVPPRNEIELGIATIWKQALGRDARSITDDFFTSGGHSLLALRLLSQIREEFGVEIPARRLFETPTIEGLAAFVSARKPAAASSQSVVGSGQRMHTPAADEVAPPHVPAAGEPRSLVAIQRGTPGQRPCFLVPGGWGGEDAFLVYAGLVRHMDPSLPLYGLRAREWSADELPERPVGELAASFIRDIRNLQPEGPYLLVGECVGGLLAYEMARQFDAAGQEISLLLLLGTPWPDEESLRTFHEWELQRGEQETAAVRRTFAQHWAEARKCSPAGMLRYAWQNLLPGALKRNIAAQTARRQRRHAWPRLLLRHRPQPYAGRVTLLQDQVTSQGPLLTKWQRFHPGEIDSCVVDGDHISYIRGHAAQTAAKLSEIIEGASHPIPC